MEFLEPPHLEYARLRKKESRDFFEFEITANRKLTQGTQAKEYLESLLHPSRGNLAQAKALIQNKANYEKEYELIFGAHRLDSSAGDAANQWVRELMSLFGTHHLKVERLAPQGIREAKDGNKIQVNVRAQGSMANLVAVLYQWAASHTSLHIERLQIAPETGQSSALSFEMDIVKILAP